MARLAIAAALLLTLACSTETQSTAGVDAWADTCPDGMTTLDGVAVDDTASDAGPDVVADTVVDSGQGADSVSDAVVDIAPISPSRWHQISSPLDDEFTARGLWGVEPDTLFAAGLAGTVLTPGEGDWEISLQEPELDILNAVSGSGPTDAWAAGMDGRLVRWNGERWEVPDSCDVDGDCAPDDPCRDGVCLEGTCVYESTFAPGCCGSTLLSFDFLEGLGMTVEDLYVDDPERGGLVWQVASLEDAESGDGRFTSAPSALYFGDPDKACEGRPCPDYDNGRAVGATATSEPFTIPILAQRATLNLQVFLDLEASRRYDIFEVLLLEGEQEFQVWSKDSLPTGSTGGRFVPVTVDLSRFIGRTMRLQLRFDSVEATDNAYEGVYVDDIEITSVCGELSEDPHFEETLWGLWGRTPDDYLAVGGEGTILRFDGQRWSRMAGGSYEVAADIDGASGEQMHVVGDGGLVIHGPKGGWMRLDGAVETNLNRVWVEGPGLALAVGDAGHGLRFDGHEWTALDMPTDVNLYGIDGVAANDAVAVGAGGTVLYWDGERWQAGGEPLTSWPLQDVSRLGPGDSVAVGGFGAVLRETAPRTWELVDAGVSEALNSVVHFASGEIMAVGFAGRFVHVLPDGSIDTGSAATNQTLFDIDGSGPDDLWAVGSQGSIVHWDGETWTAVPPVVDLPLSGVYVVAPDDVWVTAPGGILLRFDGSTWEIVRSTTHVTLRAVWSPSSSLAVAVGADATIMHFDGINWLHHFIEPVELPDSPDSEEPWYPDGALHAVWGTASDDIWAVGAAGLIVHWDGETWTYTQSLDDRRRTLWALWGRATDDIWAVGAEGVVLHWDGRYWQVEETDSISTLYGVWGIGEHVWAVGSLACILKREVEENQ